MKKAVFFLFALTSLSVYGQSQKELSKLFIEQQRAYQQEYDKNFTITNKTFDIGVINEERSRLAGFIGGAPIFIEPFDLRANRSANVPAVQEGTLPGMDGLKILGEGVNILVMDGGRIFEKHIEFNAVNGVPTIQRIFQKENQNVNYSSHATSVASVIGAIGAGNIKAPYGQKAAYGVLPLATFDSYSFHTTEGRDNYTKLTLAENANISNHSYGIARGWIYQEQPSPTYPQKGWYWTGAYELNSRDTHSGSYYTPDQKFDQIVYSNPEQVVIKSAGNEFGKGPGPGDKVFKYDKATSKYVPFGIMDELPPANCSEGYNCIGWGSLAKNIIVVGATTQLDTPNNQYTSPDDVVKAGYSSAGPRKDGAIKPDISAVGSDMMVATYAGDIQYNTYSPSSGTSFSAPLISGVAGALTELTRKITGNPQFRYKADEMKTLLTHTANEAGEIGPDVNFGWGFVDAGKAATAIINKNAERTVFERKILQTGSKQTVDVYSDGTKPLKATISWVDPAAKPFLTEQDLQSNFSSRLVNDLDLRIVDTTTGEIFYPWRLDLSAPLAPAVKGDNTVDNVEQVLLENPVKDRKYRIEVSSKGILKNEDNQGTDQAYALLITGINLGSTMAVPTVSKESITVYPTVASSEVNVLIPGMPKSIEVYDMAGKRVLSTRAKSFQTIDISRLPAGMYLIKIDTDGETVTKKIIKK